MSIPSLPLVIFFLLPGFLSIYSGFLVSRVRRLSSFQGTAWSLFAGLLIIATVYPAYTNIVKPPDSIEAWPGLLDILENPRLVPGQVWALLYVVAPFVGILVGLADRTGLFESLLRPVGIDLRLHGDIWGRLLRSRVYVYVHLTDESVLFGWPEHYSSDRSQPGPELYLTQVRIWNPDDSEWVELEHTRGVLLDASQIKRIEFLELPDNSDNQEIAA